MERMFPIRKDVEKVFRRVERLFVQGRVEDACSLLNEQGKTMTIFEHTDSLLLQGHGLFRNFLWSQARDCYKRLLLLHKTFDLPEHKKKLRTLSTFFFRALLYDYFQAREEERAVILALQLYRKGSSDILLQDVIFLCREHRLWDKEIFLWERMYSFTPEKEKQWGILFEKACALVRAQRIDEAEELFSRVMRAEPEKPYAYEWKGGILLMRGSIIRARYFLEKAYLLGGKGIGFYRNLFLTRLVAKNFSKVEELLPSLSEEAGLFCEVMETFLLGIKPDFFHSLCDDLKQFLFSYRRGKGRPHKILHFLERVEKVVESCQRKDEEFHRYIIPLAQLYWECPISNELSYFERIEVLRGFTVKEIEVFLGRYEGSVDLSSYQRFIEFYQANSLLGIMLLTFSQVLNAFYEACKELGRNFVCTLYFEPFQEEPFLYKEGSIIFGGRSLLFIEDEAEFRGKVRKLLVGGE